MKSARLWRAAAYAVAVTVAVPIATVFAAWALPTPPDLWPHLTETVLPRVVLNTVVLLGGVLTGTFVLGVPLAWLTALTEFPGRRFLSWALLAPMAMPAYVLGFVYCGLLEYAGPVQTALRAWLGPSFGGFPSIRSTGGVIVVMTFALFPYVYMISRAAFVSQGAKALEAGRALGLAPRAALWRLGVPLARPWILGALALVAMETLADFGTVSIFVYETFTTAIYKAWLGFFSPAGAAQLASLLVLVVFGVLWAETRFDKRKIYTSMGTVAMPPQRMALSGGARWGAAFLAWGVFALSFLVPIAQLLLWAYDDAATRGIGRLAELTTHSVVLGVATATTATLAALVLVLAPRLTRMDADARPRGQALAVAGRVASLGYALPGSVLAVGVFLPLIWIDKRLTTLLERIFDTRLSLVLTGTVVVMILGLTVRFLAVAFSTLAGGADRIPRRLDEAAALYGVTGWRAIIRLYLPLLKPGLATGALLVFVDVVKEMPLTLMTRPFGWDTLSVRIFEMTNEGEWQRAALPATLLVAAGLIPALLLGRAAGGSRGARGGDEPSDVDPSLSLTDSP